MELSGAQIIVEELLAHGVDTVFGYPGGTLLPLYDRLYDYQDKIKHIITAHEQGAAHAADGYARASGRTGVVIATSGPGATNLVTGIANAFLDSIPMVAITGNVDVDLLGQDSFQEVDIVGITQPIVKHNFVVREIGMLAQTLREAFEIAASGRKGPVLVDVPKNIQLEVCEYKKCDRLLTAAGTDKAPERPELDGIIKEIKNSKRPFIYAGGGIIASGAEAELLELSKRISAPVGFSMMGLSAIPTDYELNVGMTGMHGKYAASVAQGECDLMIALGVRFSDRATGNIEEYKRNHTIIHVDIDLAEIDKNVMCQYDICCDAGVFLKALLDELEPVKNDEWVRHISGLKKSHALNQEGEFSPQKIIQAVSGFCDNDTIVATDVGQHQMWTMQYYKIRTPRTILSSGGLGTMGFGLGAAIGGCVANGRKKTFLITSDGSFGMNLNELATAVSERLPIVVIVMNNGALGMVRQLQALFYDGRYSQTTLNRNTDFAAVGRAFGADGYKAQSIEELCGILRKSSSDKPTVIECAIDIDEKILPMIPQGLSLKDIII